MTSAERFRKEQEWLKSHRKEYGGKWVVLDGDVLIADSDEYRDVFEAARGKNYLVTWVEREDELPFGGW